MEPGTWVLSLLDCFLLITSSHRVWIQFFTPQKYSWPRPLRLGWQPIMAYDRHKMEVIAAESTLHTYICSIISISNPLAEATQQSIIRNGGKPTEHELPALTWWKLPTFLPSSHVSMFSFYMVRYVCHVLVQVVVGLMFFLSISYHASYMSALRILIRFVWWEHSLCCDHAFSFYICHPSCPWHSPVDEMCLRPICML